MKKQKSKLRRRLPLVAIFILLITGLCFFMYPIIGNWYMEYSAQATIKAYDEAVQKMGNDALKQYAEKAREYNEALANNEREKASLLNYDSILAVTDSIGYIDIPVLGVYYPIYHGLSDEVLQKGIGHMEGTSLPIGGESTHSVLAGHTGLPSTKLFTDLDTMQVGDEFYIHVLDQVLCYRVDQIRVVLPAESDFVRIEKGKDYVTLVTCTPYGINDHRLLVRGSRVSFGDHADGQTDDSNGSDSHRSGVNMDSSGSQSEQPLTLYHREPPKVPARTILWYAAAGLVLFVIVGIVVILVFPGLGRKKKKKKKDTASAPQSGDHIENQHDNRSVTNDQEE